MRFVSMLPLVFAAACLPSQGGEGEDLGVGGGADLGARDFGGVVSGDGGGGGAPDLAPAPTEALGYVGSYGNGITLVRLDLSTGMLEKRTAFTTITGSPSFLERSADGRFLYAVREGSSQASAFSIGADGALTFVNDVSSGGSGPAHLSRSPSGRHLLVANYGDGKLTVIAVGQSDGRLGAATHNLDGCANAHQVVADGRTGAVYVPCKGEDSVKQYSLNATGVLSPLGTGVGAMLAGAGPRHAVLHPTLRVLYVLGENDSHVVAFPLDANGLVIAPMLGRWPTLPVGFSGQNTGAEIALHPSARWLYASNRGHDSIARFVVGSDGRLTAAGQISTAGRTPRHFSIDPTGRWLVVANQTSGTLVVFSIDQGTGALTQVGNPVSTPSPAFVGAWRVR
jgi:6-phosphogluconolactonase